MWMQIKKPLHVRTSEISPDSIFLIRDYLNYSVDIHEILMKQSSIMHQC